MFDVAVIGAGVIGAAIARELSKYELDIVVLERENDVSVGTSKANSGIVHAGYDPEENTLMAKFSAKGNALFDDMCKELCVPFVRNGSLVVAFDDEQLAHIHALKQRGENNGVPGLEILSKEQLLEKETNINPAAKAALFAPSAGIIDPMLLTIALVENAVMNGVSCLLNFEVISIKKEGAAYQIMSPDNCVSAKYVINAAGVFADEVHNMIAPPAFAITPVRGQYFLLDKEEKGIVNATIFPCPTEKGKGMLIVPTVHGNVMLGPTYENLPDKEDLATTEEMLEQVSVGVKQLVPQISVWRNNIRTFAGLRAVAEMGDFIVQEAAGAPNFFDVAGIKSPGLSTAPAIALYVAALLEEKGVALHKKPSFDPNISRRLFSEMTEEEQSAKIKENPLYGRVICRCENITEGDIVDAIKAPIGATTLEGVKRRCRAGMGRCQSGFCGPKVQEILARELGRTLDEVMLEKNASYILTGRTK